MILSVKSCNLQLFNFRLNGKKPLTTYSVGSITKKWPKYYFYHFKISLFLSLIFIFLNNVRITQVIRGFLKKIMLYDYVLKLYFLKFLK